MADFEAQSRIRELAHRKASDMNDIRSVLTEIRKAYSIALNEAQTEK